MRFQNATAIAPLIQITTRKTLAAYKSSCYKRSSPHLPLQNVSAQDARLNRHRQAFLTNAHVDKHAPPSNFILASLPLRR
jgi:hypothetical protein